MLMRMKDNYYIKKCYGDFVLLKSKKNQENAKRYWKESEYMVL